MKALPLLDLSDLHAGAPARKVFLEALDQAARSNGFFYLTHHGISPALTQAVLEQSRRFFDLDAAEKNRMHIRHSDHFRGYSQMKNERDWREQVHFGQELPAVPVAENSENCYRLIGENQWPVVLGEPFRSTMLEFLQATSQLGDALLSAFAELLGQPTNYFRQLSAAPPYLLMKLICYYAQPNTVEDRPGVAPHCDWSWLTILLQDDVGGLEVLTQAGDWQPVAPAEGVLSVNVGELLEILTRGQYLAAPHRVINPSEEKKRISVPVFINPPLDALVSPLNLPATPIAHPPQEHIHRVCEQGLVKSGFPFGPSEWERKGLGKWCHNTACLQH